MKLKIKKEIFDSNKVKKLGERYLKEIELKISRETADGTKSLEENFD